MDRMLTLNSPLRRLNDWLVGLAIVADDADGVESDFLPTTVLLDRVGAPSTLVHAMTSPPA